MTHDLQKSNAIIIDLAQRIVKHGMATPAIFFLDMSKYVSFLGSQIMVFLGPIITVFIRGHKYYKIAELLEDRNNIEFLLCEIERLSSATHSKNIGEK